MREDDLWLAVMYGCFIAVFFLVVRMIRKDEP
jgi:cbb3-type cytochrome oxidase subunit 3